ncbi:MAG TPA: hypothetical protein PKD17_05530 [Cellvibrionaceae bacterium]|nr:hypothetical protein [Cellvibrionaceae bacterium]HMW71257.1 hypothetical protein [Cellvibrionaceae bacterium]HMY39393.1 hypothetical protein [Marinagarivorans sp.]HNG60311.1 hypothetical protein [Cellvibrionaceae bacterium]
MSNNQSLLKSFFNALPLAEKPGVYLGDQLSTAPLTRMKMPLHRSSN